MDQHNRNKKIRAPSVQRPYEPTQSNAMVKSLQAVPRFSGGGHIDQRKQNACHELEHETRERRAAEDIEPLAVSRGTGCSAISRIGVSSRRRRSNQSPIVWIRRMSACLLPSLLRA